MMRVPLGAGHSAGDVLRLLRDDRAPFALVGRWAGARALVGSEPVRVEVDPVDPFALLDDLEPVEDAPPGFVGGGWFGHLGYRLGALIEDVTPSPPRPDPLPAAVLAFYDHVLRLDLDGTWWFEALAPEHERLEALRARLGREAPPARRCRLVGMGLRAPAAAGHRAAVAEGVERIRAGEIFQANLCLRLDGRLDGEPLDAFADGVAALEPAHGAYFGGDWGAVVSFSPELFLRRTGRQVHCALIKGTAERTGEDDEGGGALAASAKDAAENVMIVDLMRNDLGRVARYGAVRAHPPHVEAHPGVWHLVTRVEAELRDGVGDGDLLRATFPPGSVTGAPKVQALQVISQLEATAREAYTGAIGFAGPAAGLELSVAIRTFEIAPDGRTWIGCGGGITADSEPDAELAEALAKVRPLVAQLGGSVPRPPRSPGKLVRLPPTQAPRPDPELGLLETLGVADGVPLDLDGHLERLARSARAVYGIGLPGGLAERVLAHAAAGAGRVRIVLSQSGAARIEPGPAPVRPAAPPVLVPVWLPGGLGEHKWADRRLVSAYERDGRTPLLVDADDHVLEAGWANVWIREGDRLITPPADGRLLPGTVRASVLASGRGVEEPVPLDRLRAAEGILLTSSVRRHTPAVL